MFCGRRGRKQARGADQWLALPGCLQQPGSGIVGRSDSSSGDNLGAGRRAENVDEARMGAGGRSAAPPPCAAMRRPRSPGIRLMAWLHSSVLRARTAGRPHVLGVLLRVHVRRPPPRPVHDELELVLASRKHSHIRKIVTAPVHSLVFAPPRERAGHVHLVAAVRPPAEGQTEAPPAERSCAHLVI